MPKSQSDSGTVVPLPTGTLTFFFSDIEGSTRRWERDRAAMAGAVAKHDAFLRAAIEEHGGYVFKTVGDAFCAAFSFAPRAVAAALAAQRSLAAADWSAVGGLTVRMALHSGDADERDGDYFGPPVNRVARLLAVAHGGQTILSAATAALVDENLPRDVTLADLGMHRLKDLARPEHVFQLCAPDLRTAFPALASLNERQTNLPAQPTSFIGREGDVETVVGELAASRLVTIVGPGGIGKSRLATQVAAQLVDASSDGTWLIELAPLGDGSLVTAAIAKTLSYELPAGSDPLEGLVAHLRSLHALLVLDNCEHLLEAATRVTSAILRSCPRVAILATSREGLGVSGEVIYRLPALAVPTAPCNTLTASEALSFSGISLFAERAASADRRFSLTDSNALCVVDICSRLDGLPLAIELVAPRVKVLSVDQIVRRLDERFQLLTGGRRDALPRQQTLRALIDWSYDLIAEAERALFRSLGIFVNGWTIDAASAVYEESTEAWRTLDLLGSLVDKSLVVAEVRDSGVRFSLLQSTRAYALEKLAEAGERETCAERHARWCESLLERTGALARQRFDDEVWKPVFDEIDNVRSAIAWSERADVGLAVRLVGLFPWHELGASDEGAGWVEKLATRSEAANGESAPGDMARLLLTGARCVETSSNRLHCSVLAARGLHWARNAGDPFLIASCLLFAMMPALDDVTLASAPDIDAKLEELRSLAPAVTSLRFQNALDNFEFVIATRLGRVERARALAASMLARVKPGSGRTFLTLRTNFAEFEHSVGATSRAIELVTDVRDEILAGRDRELSRGLLTNVAGYCCAERDLEGARVHARLALTFAPVPAGGSVSATFALEHLALVLALQHEVETSARLAGFCEATLSRLGATRSYTEWRTSRELDALLEAAFDADRRRELQAAGSTLTSDDAVALALRS